MEDEDAQRRYLTRVSEAYSPESQARFGAKWKDAGTWLRANVIRRPFPQGHGLAPALGLFHILSQLPEAALALYSFRLTAADMAARQLEPKARDSSTAIFPSHQTLSLTAQSNISPLY